MNAAGVGPHGLFETGRKSLGDRLGIEPRTQSGKSLTTQRLWRCRFWVPSFIVRYWLPLLIWRRVI